LKISNLNIKQFNNFETQSEIGSFLKGDFCEVTIKLVEFYNGVAGSNQVLTFC